MIWPFSVTPIELEVWGLHTGITPMNQSLIIRVNSIETEITELVWYVLIVGMIQKSHLQVEFSTVRYLMQVMKPATYMLECIMKKVVSKIIVIMVNIA